MKNPVDYVFLRKSPPQEYFVEAAQPLLFYGALCCSNVDGFDHITHCTKIAMESLDLIEEIRTRSTS